MRNGDLRSTLILPVPVGLLRMIETMCDRISRPGT
jgi:hypothetical protein